jgi:hypothetical protein
MEELEVLALVLVLLVFLVEQVEVGMELSVVVWPLVVVVPLGMPELVVLVLGQELILLMNQALQAQEMAEVEVVVVHSGHGLIPDKVLLLVAVVLAC